jgi:hypothetical protein
MNVWWNWGGGVGVKGGLGLSFSAVIAAFPGAKVSLDVGEDCGICQIISIPKDSAQEEQTRPRLNII